MSFTSNDFRFNFYPNWKERSNTPRSEFENRQEVRWPDRRRFLRNKKPPDVTTGNTRCSISRYNKQIQLLQIVNDKILLSAGPTGYFSCHVLTDSDTNLWHWKLAFFTNCHVMRIFAKDWKSAQEFGVGKSSRIIVEHTNRKFVALFVIVCWIVFKRDGDYLGAVLIIFTYLYETCCPLVINSSSYLTTLRFAAAKLTFPIFVSFNTNYYVFCLF